VQTHSAAGYGLAIVTDRGRLIVGAGLDADGLVWLRGWLSGLLWRRPRSGSRCRSPARTDLRPPSPGPASGRSGPSRWMPCRKPDRSREAREVLAPPGRRDLPGSETGPAAASRPPGRERWRRRRGTRPRPCSPARNRSGTGCSKGLHASPAETGSAPARTPPARTPAHRSSRSGRRESVTWNREDSGRRGRGGLPTPRLTAGRESSGVPDPVARVSPHRGTRREGGSGRDEASPPGSHGSSQTPSERNRSISGRSGPAPSQAVLKPGPATRHRAGSPPCDRSRDCCRCRNWCPRCTRSGRRRPPPGSCAPWPGGSEGRHRSRGGPSAGRYDRPMRQTRTQLNVPRTNCPRHRTIWLGPKIATPRPSR